MQYKYHELCFGSHLRIIEAMLGIEDGEHSLVESAEKLSQSTLQVDFTVVVIVLEVSEEIYEDVRVPLVDDTVSFVKELVKFKL